MKITEKYINDIINGIPVGDFPPFIERDSHACYTYSKNICKSIEYLSTVESFMQDENYGSGYASYLELFITKKDKSYFFKKDSYLEIRGIILYISKLTPIAVFGEGEITKNYKGGGAGGFIYNEIIGTYPEGDWSFEIEQIIALLSSKKYSLLTKEEGNKKLWFPTQMPTILGEETVFDALFYWED